METGGGSSGESWSGSSTPEYTSRPSVLNLATPPSSFSALDKRREGAVVQASRSPRTRRDEAAVLGARSLLRQRRTSSSEGSEAGSPSAASGAASPGFHALAPESPGGRPGGFEALGRVQAALDSHSLRRKLLVGRLRSLSDAGDAYPEPPALPIPIPAARARPGAADALEPPEPPSPSGSSSAPPSPKVEGAPGPRLALRAPRLRLPRRRPPGGPPRRLRLAPGFAHDVPPPPPSSPRPRRRPPAPVRPHRPAAPRSLSSLSSAPSPPEHPPRTCSTERAGRSKAGAAAAADVGRPLLRLAGGGAGGAGAGGGGKPGEVLAPTKEWETELSRRLSAASLAAAPEPRPPLRS
eukprot:tig00020684_g12903.t1